MGARDARDAYHVARCATAPVFSHALSHAHRSDTLQAGAGSSRPHAADNAGKNPSIPKKASGIRHSRALPARGAPAAHPFSRAPGCQTPHAYRKLKIGTENPVPRAQTVPNPNRYIILRTPDTGHQTI